QIDAPAGGAIAYAYVEAAAKFEIPFFENDEPFEFTDSAGKKTIVTSFGVRKKDDYAYEKLRKQVHILYRAVDRDRRGSEISEFIVDPCMTSKPYQIVLARIDRKTTLAQTLADVQSRIASEHPNPYLASMNPVDTLLAPNMVWQISHNFRELEGQDK